PFPDMKVYELYRDAKRHAMRMIEATVESYTKRNNELIEREKALHRDITELKRSAKYMDRQRLLKQISHAESSPDRSYRQILPAWRGQLRAIERELQTLDSSLQESLK